MTENKGSSRPSGWERIETEVDLTQITKDTSSSRPSGWERIET